MRTTTWRDCNRPSATADNRESKYSSRRKFRNESGNRGGAHCVHRKRYWIYARITIARWKRPEETSRHLETSASLTLPHPREPFETSQMGHEVSRFKPFPEFRDANAYKSRSLPIHVRLWRRAGITRTEKLIFQWERERERERWNRDDEYN